MIVFMSDIFIDWHLFQDLDLWLVSSWFSLTSLEEGALLALVGHPSSDGVIN